MMRTEQVNSKEGLEESLVAVLGKKSILIKAWFARQGLSCMLVVANGLMCQLLLRVIAVITLRNISMLTLQRTIHERLYT